VPLSGAGGDNDAMTAWAQLRRHPEFARGARDMTGISLGIGAWGLVTGIAMVKSGLGLGLSVVMSLAVFAGSAQLAALPLIAHGAPLWVVWATAFCINLRFVIFSASWQRYFGTLPLRRRMTLAYFTGDLNYICFMRRFPTPQSAALGDRVAYFWGSSTVNWCAWQVLSLLGIALAHVIPTEWGLDFAGTLALLGLVGTLLADRSTWVAAAVAGSAAVASIALPFHLNIVVAIAAAVGIGVLMDHYTPPREVPAGTEGSR